MKKIITLLMLTFIVSISFAQYTPMTAAGYQFKRILCDSTLHIPSFCGIPTLRNSTAKNGAIAMDTCNYKIYMWTNAVGWGEIIGAGTDTTSLSLRIDQRVKYTDTAAMLLAYLRKQDTANKWVANVTRVNDTTIRVFKGNTITDLKILGKQVDTTSLSNRIDQKLSKSDSTIYYTKYRSDTSRTNIYNAINTKLSKSDSTLFYTKYRSDTSRTNIYNAINQKLNITDTTNKWVNNVTKVNDSTIRVWKGTTSTTIELPRGSGGGGGTGTVYNVSTGYALNGGPINTTGTIIVDSAVLSTKYLRRADTSNLVATKSNLALKLNIADTAVMLSKYLRKTDTASLSNRINLKVNISDTATMLSNYLRKTDTASLSNRINLKLNITDTSNKWVNAVTKKNDSTITVFKGATATDIILPRGSSGGGGTVTNVATGYGLSGGPITSTGTIIVDSATLSSKYLRRTDTSNLVATKNNLALKLNIADTTNKWVNAVTKINDTAIRVWKGTTSSVISLAKDVVYTQSPIMSKVSNDSNIIYFNPDTANVWRGGGSGIIPSLQDVATVGNTYVNDYFATLELNKFSNPNNYYPFYFNSDPSLTNDNGYIEFADGQGTFKMYRPSNQGYGIIINADSINLFNKNYNSEVSLSSKRIHTIQENKDFYYNILFPNDWNTYNYDVHLPLGNIQNEDDTLATLRDLRSGGGGIGTVTSVATGYGLTGGPITTTGTLVIDTTTATGLSGKYVRLSDTSTMLLPYLFGSGTANYIPKFKTSRKLAKSLIYDNDTTIGINTITPSNSYKLDVNGSARFTSFVGIESDLFMTKYSNLYIEKKGSGSGNGLTILGNHAFDGSNVSQNILQILSSVSPINPSTGTNIYNMLSLNPKYEELVSTYGGALTTLRGYYYNPTIVNSAGLKNNIAFQSTAGDIILNNLKTSTSTSDSIAIFINDTLKKAPYPSVSAVSSGYYGAFSDTLSQSITSTTTAYPMNFRVTDLSNGVTVTNNNRVVFANTGIYNLQYSAQFTNSSTSTEVGISVWIRKNGIDVAGSNGYIQLPKKGSGLNGETLPSWNFVLSLTAGDSIVWYWRADNTSASITSFAASTSPTRPSTASTILTVTQQSGIMAGTGITAINSLTGAAQTMVTGTDSSDFKIVSTGSSHTFNLPTASSTKRGALSSTDWSTFNGKIGTSDTSVFQRKSLSANTIMANNTNATANVTAQTFIDNTEQAMSNTISFTGTAPTTLTSANYSWSQIGKTVTVNFNAIYTNPGTTITSMFFNLPSDMPAPLVPTGWTGASAYLYVGSASLYTTSILQNNILASSFIRRNAANSAYEIGINSASATARGFKFTLTYKAQ